MEAKFVNISITATIEVLEILIKNSIEKKEEYQVTQQFQTKNPHCVVMKWEGKRKGYFVVGYTDSIAEYLGKCLLEDEPVDGGGLVVMKEIAVMIVDRINDWLKKENLDTLLGAPEFTEATDMPEKVKEPVISIALPLREEMLEIKIIVS